MPNYKLEYIEGTLLWVKDELRKKHPSIKILEEKKVSIVFSSEEDLKSFGDLLCCIRIWKGGNKNSLNLSRKDWRKEFVPAGISPTLAYILCKIAKIEKNDNVLDPFCGAGTIAITASKYFAPKKVLASDVSGKAIDKAQINTKEAKAKNIILFRSNISQLNIKDKVNKTITNLPFGIREKSHEKNKKIYQDFFIQANKIMIPGGLVVALTQEIKLIQEIFKDKNLFTKIAEYKINQGGLSPHIFVYKKK